MNARLHPAERLELALGDPADPHSRMPAAQTLEDDERECFPARACAQLQALRYNQCFVPAEFGGTLTSFEEALMLVRVVSRRDLSVAIALGQTYLGSVAIWLGGDTRQRQRASAQIEAGDAFALALTEREHGSDVLANEVSADPVAGGFLLRGEKWLINNGTRARALTLFARTAQPGPRGYSLFFVDVAALAPPTYEHTPKIRTHGIRGADISGIRFDAAFVPADALIGAPGGALELTLKGLMITRMMCAGFALGAADTALRLALRFAGQRRLYGTTVAELPAPARTLAECFADVIAADVLALCAVRGAHVDPRTLSLSSAVVKVAVPAIVETIVGRCATVLGARSYLRDLPPWSLFQKIERDVRVVGLFDGSSGINLQAVVAQLPALARRLAGGPQDAEGAATTSARLAAIFDRGRALPAFDGSQIELTARGRDDVLTGLPDAAHALARYASSDASLALGASVASELVDALATLCAEVTALPTQAQQASSVAFDIARRFCYLHAAAALVHTFLWGVGERPGIPAAVFTLGLARLAERAGCQRREMPEATYAQVVAAAMHYDRLGRLFSIIPIQIVDAVPAPEASNEALAAV